MNTETITDLPDGRVLLDCRFEHNGVPYGMAATIPRDYIAKARTIATECFALWRHRQMGLPQPWDKAST